MSLRSKFLDAIGLTESEVEGGNKADGPLDELMASYLEGGPFKIVLTPYASRHLTFLEGRGKRTLRILETGAVLRIYMSQRMGLTAYTGIQCSALTS